MKLKIYLHKAATRTKGAETDEKMRHVCFRVREGNIDIRYRSEILANVDYWSDAIPGYLSTRKLPASEIKQMNKRLADLSSLISREFTMNADGAWLKDLIESYLHPKVADVAVRPSAKRTRLQSWHEISKTLDEGSFCALMLEYAIESDMCEGRKNSYATTVKKLRRFELWQRQVMGIEDFSLQVDTISTENIEDFKLFIENEYIYYKEYPEFYDQFTFSPGKQPHKLTENFVMGTIKFIKGFMNHNIKHGLTTNISHKNVHLHRDIYATPIYLTLEERDQVFYYDLSKHPRLVLYRDVFMFQCLVGCRVGDLYNFTYDNIKGDWLEYFPSKGIGGADRSEPRFVRVPLCPQAKELIKKYEDAKRGTLFPFHAQGFYNYGIKMLLLLCGIDRLVTTRDPETKELIEVPLYEAATTHTARKTFIANLYKKVKDPDLIASMTGHAPGSRAFNRYREIDDGVKQELIAMID